MAGSSGDISSILLCNELPNPFTPMAFLPPHLALQAKISEFVIACSLAVLIWDLLHTLSDDYQLVFKKQFRWPTAVYFISRISALAYLVGKNVQLNSQIDHCKLSEVILQTCFVFFRASTLFLMYCRVCAVYNMKRVVVLFFGFTWLGVVAGAATTFTGLEGTYIGPTKYCTARVKHDYIITVSVISLINDTLIFLAIIYKLGMADVRRSTTPQISNSAALKSTGHLQSFTKIFLQDSQIYYSIAVVLNFATLITFFATNNSHQSPFRFIMIYPETVVVNIMACRVFRNVKFGRHSQILIIPTQINTGNLTQHDYNLDMGGENSYHIGDMNMPSSVELSRRNKSAKLPTPDSNRRGIEKPNNLLGGVEVTKVIELTRS